MSDPVRHKNKKEISVEVTYRDNNGVATPLRFYLTVNKDVIEKLTREQLSEVIRKDLSSVSPNPVSGIYSNLLSFNYDDPESLKDFDYANTLVEVHLPYCLHIPNEYELEVFIPEENLKALVILKKIWTNKATAEGVRSLDIDFFAEDRTLYFQKSVILNPVVPLRPEEGWEQNFTGENIEKIKEKNGVFRYSQLYIQFDSNISKEQLDSKEGKEILERVKEKALLIVNRLIDSYRFVTSREHVQRLGSLGVNMIYFINHDRGFYTLSSGFGIETAPINRSRKEIAAIRKMLGNGERPELYSLLLLDAKSSYENKDYALAVVQSFQALEICLENSLLAELHKRGDSEDDSLVYLDKYWRTKERLRYCIKELRGVSLYEDNRALWDKWCTLYDQTRNEIIHKSKEPTSKDVSDTLDTNIKVLNWLKVT